MHGSLSTFRAAAAAVLLVFWMGLPAWGAESKGRFLRLEVTEAGKSRPTVKVNLPLSLVEAMLDVVAVSDEDLTIERGVIGVGDRKVDVRKVLEELEGLPPTEFVTIEDEEATVRIWLD